MECKSCGHKQTEGKFCEACGNELSAVVETGSIEKDKASSEAAIIGNEEDPPPLEDGGLLDSDDASDLLESEELIEIEGQDEISDLSSSEKLVENEDQAGAQGNGNDAVEKVKEASSAYFGYFMSFLTKPNHDRVKENEFLYGMINIILALLLFSLAHQKYISNIFVGESLGFKYWINSFMFVLVAMGVAYLLIFVVKQLFSTKEMSFLELLSTYGLYMTPLVPLGILTAFFTLIGVDKLSSFLVYFMLFLMIFLIPLYIVSHLLVNHSKTLEAFYAYLLFIIGFFLGIAIVDAILLDSIIPFTPVPIIDFSNLMW